MTFLNKVTFLSVLCAASTFLIYPMDSDLQNRESLNRLESIISRPDNTREEVAQFFVCLDRLPVGLIRDYRIEGTGNSLLHLAAFYEKPLFVGRLFACEFNLYEENNRHFNPLGLAIRNILIESNSHSTHLNTIKLNLQIIEMFCCKDMSFSACLSYVLFLLLKCAANTHDNRDELLEIINGFYRKYHDHIDIEESFGGQTSFDLVIDNEFVYILLKFLRTSIVSSLAFNNRLEELLLLTSQFQSNLLLDEILEQSNLNKTLLRDLIHDNLASKLSAECTSRIVSFLDASAPHLLATPAAAAAAAHGVDQVFTFRTRSVRDSVNIGATKKQLFPDQDN